MVNSVQNLIRACNLKFQLIRVHFLCHITKIFYFKRYFKILNDIPKNLMMSFSSSSGRPISLQFKHIKVVSIISLQSSGITFNLMGQFQQCSTLLISSSPVIFSPATKLPIELKLRSRAVRVEFDLRESLNAIAPSSPIELPIRLSAMRVSFDLRESLNAIAPESPIEL